MFKIDVASGTVQFGDQLTLRPLMAEQDIVSRSGDQLWSPKRRSDPSRRCLITLTVGQQRFYLSLYLYRKALVGIDIVDISRWKWNPDHLDERKELARDKLHKALLQSMLGVHEWEGAWGKICCIFDPERMKSFILIKYAFKV